MRNILFIKGLVIGIIVLFLGLYIQPVFAINKTGKNNPPDKPDIIGPSRGKPGIEYNYIFVTSDPEGDDVLYFVDWGDGTSTGWTDYVPSESNIMLSHTWDEIYDYSIRVKAKDINGLEGEWSDLIIEISVDSKDFLFQTIIDIANNPEVKELLEKNKYNLFTFDSDRIVYRKIFFRNPRLFRSIMSAKPFVTYDSLENLYKNGIKIIELIGEDRSLEIMESINIKNEHVYEEFNNIIENDEELSEKISILENLNFEISSTGIGSRIVEIFCTILMGISMGIFGIAYVIAMFFGGISDFFSEMSFNRLAEFFSITGLAIALPFIGVWLITFMPALACLMEPPPYDG